MDLNKTMIIDDYKCIIRNDYLQEMNDKILNRRFPDMELQPNLDERPISTKYSLFPIIETMQPKGKQYLEHYTELNFAPCSNNGPVKNVIHMFHLKTNYGDKMHDYTKEI